MIRIGLIGLDSSHALEFTRLFHAPPFCAEARVVAACPGLPTDFPLSVRRRDAIAHRLQAEHSIPILGSTEEVLHSADAFLVLGCDGRGHAADSAPLLDARKPVFIDKPLTADWREAAEILRRARRAGAPCFSASALRFRQADGFREYGVERRRPVRLAVDVPRAVEPGHPDLSWHGIHGVEAGYGILGAGCRTVTRRITAVEDVTTGEWPDGSALVIRRTDEDSGREFCLVTEPGPARCARGHDYRELLARVLRFFATGESPVPPAEMVEVLAFIDAADVSRDARGRAVELRPLLAGVDL